MIGYYREMIFENYGLARLGRQLMSNQLVAYRSGTGALAVELGRRVHVLNAVSPRLFAAQHEPNTLYFSFLDLDGDGSVDHAQVNDMAFERIRPWQAPSVQQGFVTVLALLAASFLLAWPILALVRSAGRADAAMGGRQGPFGPRKSATMLGIACLLQITSLVGVSYWVSEPQSGLLAFGLPQSLQLLQWVALAAMLTVPFLFVSVVRAWIGRYWTTP